MSISENLQKLAEIKNNLYKVLVDKGADIDSSTLFDEYPGILENLNVGTTVISSGVVKETQEQAYTDSVFTPEKINDTNALAYTDSVSYDLNYDESKFTFIGDVTVSDDGIASGFSSSSYLSADFDNTIDMTTDTFRIKGRAAWVDNFDESPYPMIFSFINSSIRLHCASNSRFYLYYASDSSTTSGHSMDITGISFYDNMEFDFDCYWNGATATCTITLDGIEYTNSASYTDYNMDEISTVYIGVNSNLLYPWGGSIDLKRFEIEKNGVIIFSGN